MHQTTAMGYTKTATRNAANLQLHNHLPTWAA